MGPNSHHVNNFTTMDVRIFNESSETDQCMDNLGMYPRLVICQHCKKRTMTTVWCQKWSKSSCLYKLVHRCPFCSAVIGFCFHSHEKTHSCLPPKRRRKIGYVKFSHSVWDQELLSNYYHGR